MITDNPELASAQQQRMRETMKLTQTKLRNIEETLKRLHAQRNNLSRHHDLFTALQEHSKHLYELNKEFSTMSREANELERFETFEGIMVPFLRMQMLNDEAAGNRRQGNALEQEIHDTDVRIEEQRTSLKESEDYRNESESSFMDTCRTLLEVCALDGKKEALEDMTRRVQEAISANDLHMGELKRRNESLAQSTEVEEERLNHLQERRHGLEIYENMLEHMDQVQELLNNMESKEHENKRNTDERMKHADELTMQKEIRNNVRNQLTDVNQKIQNLQNEINIHRTNIRGMQSFDVQEKVLDLKSRIQMLLSAQSLWRRIATGYATIEEKTRLINSMSQQIEYDLRNEQELTEKVGDLRRQVKDREYSLTISKSQNVVQLRADLSEGTACSVCGSTHHPFHSDTMLEQSKLISDMRSEFETMSLELSGKKNQLRQLHDKLTKSMGQLVAEQQNLEIVRLRQSEDVKEWGVYSTLDATFQECLPSTDAEARTAMIRQLLDNTQRELQTATAELKEFNYHSSQIDVLSEQVESLEEQKDELTAQMAAANTACQIIKARVEYLNAVIKIVDERYQQLYDQLMTTITLPEWYRRWKENPTQLRSTLRLMHDEWQEINSKLADEQLVVEGLHVQQSMIKDIITEVATTQDMLREEGIRIADGIKRINGHRESLLSDTDTSMVLENGMIRLQEAKRRLENSRNTMEELVARRNLQEGTLTGLRQTGTHLDEQARSQQSRVDLWIHAYNASHPPVQYQELSDVLTQDVDWTEKRKRVRQNMMDTLLEKQTVKALQAEIVGLQIDTGTLTADQLDARIMDVERNIVAEEEKLRQTLMQLTKIKLQLGLE